MWNSWLSVRDSIKAGLCYQIRKGNKVKIWEHPWLPTVQGQIPSAISQEAKNYTLVEELLDNTGRNWNRDLVKRLFSDTDSEAILNLKDLDPSLEDKLRWKHDKNGTLSVASVYAKLADDKWRNMDIAESSKDHSDAKAMRKRSWSLRIKGKIRHFIWRSVENLQPVLLTLFNKKLAHDPICRICGSEVESLEHLFFLCPRAQIIWKLSPVSWDGMESDNLNFKRWWTRLCLIKNSVGVSDRINLTAYILWSIWKSRNLILFQNIWKPEKFVVESACKEWLEYSASFV
ncbi:Unknown protein [Striga hermonthica]|uniref:Reverse transcriptase zinc-binding domain-containing protein n=1 Tax=Striga hermonthica TaxID=68872 RepID=A0A9N7RCS0_STRHE|nr:Unknown protein [Striga hermonthica]